MSLSSDETAPRLWWDEAQVPSEFGGVFELMLSEQVWPDTQHEALKRWARVSDDDHLIDLARDPAVSQGPYLERLHVFWHDGTGDDPEWRHSISAPDGNETLRVRADGSWELNATDSGQHLSGTDADLPSSSGDWVRAAALHTDLLVEQMVVESELRTQFATRAAVESKGRPLRFETPYDDPWPPGDRCSVTRDAETGLLLALSLSDQGNDVTSLTARHLTVMPRADTTRRSGGGDPRSQD